MKTDFSPMTETAYYILLSLLKERHGYGIMQYVAQITQGRINLGAGTVYGTLGKLEKNKLILNTREEDKRKYYLITQEGKEVLINEFERITELYENGKELASNGR